MRVIVMSHCGLTRLSLEIITKGIRDILDKQQDIHVELHSTIDSNYIYNPSNSRDVVILDNTSSIQLLNAIEQIRTLNPLAFIMAICSKPESSGDFICLSGACDGVVCKTASIDKIETMIIRLLSSRILPKKFDRITFSIKIKSQLTQRENEILEYILLDLSNSYIASELDMKNKTVSAHRRNVYNKLGVKEINGILKVLLMPQ
ncbi:LuxR C-terminal-related transcriptional regulator [Yersinia alsatica]|uniref:LuxR C-terminal-related transcriptional regulator n=4 Tax=Yersinia alsatica TaxID=2890317 RepID=A0ABY5UPA1_9GAMM|nr:LuxR C-terminal-related transcriptional regulator [Yersinia alsatica]OWF67203.1 helix-turn-helix transcriptional regulator [Yersinia frederiksenii]UWM43952.1 LuxR C-terminal-related transcriptional regulator [Yersinia alsatica]